MIKLKIGRSLSGERFKYIDHQIFYKTNQGRRKNNQDTVYAKIFSKKKGLLAVLAVADGMGGHAAGDIASQIAIERLKKDCSIISRIYMNGSFKRARDEIVALYSRIYREIAMVAHKNPQVSDLGTTLVIAWLFDRGYVISNIGDSRCYQIHNGNIMQLTEDHSAIADSLKKGIITERDAKKSIYKDALLRSLDAHSDYIPDIFPKQQDFFPIIDDLLIFTCSDGLSKFVSEIEIVSSLIDTKNIKSACQHMSSKAFLNGSDDNISVAILELGKVARSKKKLSRLPSIEKLVKYDKKEKQKGTKAKARRKLICTFAVLLTVILFVLIGLLLKNIFIDEKAKEQQGGTEISDQNMTGENDNSEKADSTVKESEKKESEE